MIFRLFYFIVVREVYSDAGNYYFGLHKLQTKKLYFKQEQTESPRPHRDEEVLQVLQRAYSSSRNEIGQLEV